MIRVTTSRFHYSAFPGRRWLLRSRFVIPGPLLGQRLLNRRLIALRHQIVALPFFFGTFFAFGIQSVVCLQSFDDMCAHYGFLLQVLLNQPLGLCSVQMRLIDNGLRHSLLHQLHVIMILAHGRKLALVDSLFCSLGSTAGLKVTREILFSLLKHSFGNFCLGNISIKRFHFFSDSLGIG